MEVASRFKVQNVKRERNRLDKSNSLRKRKEEVFRRRN